ncbi:hypothetical protein SAMN02745134_01038 [Clostridium acidisoli DSM 12555]|jgi:hypothetical protein|uniref:Rho termination factor, N-terminal domain n=1 Tax=Clostridium acidisoli DSM 12555 TaxID=1121291 RepID=A0A1W1X863_9CLOT|nr:hypothetical protein [Clostridium acidisoli]SMC20116.1 hypothetical protein SAMN02745134_01038 [Clostridium acidisoli DSM 12555]
MTNDEIYKRIIVMTSVKGAIAYIKTCDIKKSDLSKLCKRYNINIVEGKATKEEIIDRFVKETLGVKLRKKAINKYNTK